MKELIGDPTQIRNRVDFPAVIMFSLIAVATIILVPTFGYFHGFSAVDWLMFVILYMASGLGITVGYHRLISHRSFECKAWVKACLLVAGGWALENSALRWCADHIRHHARCDENEDPYNATKGFWHSHCGWIFEKSPYRDEKYETRLRKDRLIMWQHRYYIPIVLSELALPFVVSMMYDK